MKLIGLVLPDGQNCAGSELEDGSGLVSGDLEGGGVLVRDSKDEPKIRSGEEVEEAVSSAPLALNEQKLGSE